MPESWFMGDVPDYIIESLTKFVDENVNAALTEYTKDVSISLRDYSDKDDIYIDLFFDDEIDVKTFSLDEVLDEEANNDYETDRLKKIASLLNKHLDRINNIINGRET